MGIYSIKNRYTGGYISAGNVQEYIDYINKLHSEISKLYSNITKLENTIEELREAIEDQQERNTFNASKETLQHQEIVQLLSIKDAEIDTLKNELENKNNEIDTLQKKYARACSGGHKKSCTDYEIEEIRKRRLDGETLEKLAKTYNVSVRTIIRYTDDLKVNLRKKTAK